MEQFGIEILNCLKEIAKRTDLLELLRIAWIVGLVGYGWRTLCRSIKAVIGVVRYAKNSDSICDCYDDDEEDDF
jgi:hypothetical protein